QRVDITQPLGDGERTEPLTKLCGAWIREGYDDATIMGMLQGWNAQKNNPPLPDDKLASTLASIRSCDNRNNAANDSIVEEFNRDHAVVALSSKTAVLKETTRGVDYMSFSSFRE